MSTQGSLHVHWAPNVRDGSHRPPEAFHKSRSFLNKLSDSVTSTFSSVMDTVTSTFTSQPSPIPLQTKRTRRIPLPSLLMRKEVPFERWFAHYSTSKEIPCTARAWAVVSSTEGFFQLIKQVVCVAFYSLTCNSESSTLHQEILSAQWQGYTLSIQAIFCPATTIKKVFDAERAEHPLIGARAPASKWTWGTVLI